MKRRTFAIGATATVVAVLVVWLAPASIAQTQIQLLDREGPFEKFVDVGRPGFSAGDQILETHPLLDPADETVVGRDFGRLTILRVVRGGEDFDVIVDSTIRLADGDIAVYGEARFSSFFTPEGGTFAIIGGTGAYRGMAGSANYAATETEGEFLITIELLAG